MVTDKLIFPIGFDLEKAVADAEGQADKLLRRLETTIKSRPLAINLKIGNAGSGSLNEINARMRDIVKEWNNLTEAERVASKTSGEYTDRAKKLIAEFIRLTGATESYARSLQQITAAARKAANEQERNLKKQRKTEAILKAQETTIANITAKLQYWKKEMNSADMGSKQFRKAAEEVKRLSHSLTEAQRRVNALTDNFRKQDGYVSRLIKRLAVYAGYQQFSNFLTSVREVTAEFELQRISLGAIIQDQAKANQLFSEIKNFALKSPVKILDLTKYTKQLAAYKFETEELFDWTKRLTDISVGLGVSMDRIILLAGQIRATGYLRGSEVRQATEAGIPLVEELAQKLEELNGRAYTTAEVMNMISERAISWEMVADVFKDMTSAGGMFFDIQEKQGNTLYGMWQKLGDAASVMYEEIGNTDSVNAGMKNLISTLRTLMLNWKQTGAALGTVGVAVLLYINRVKLAETWIKLSIIAESKSVIALKSKQAALARLTAIQRASTGAVKADTVATKLWTAVKLRGAQALNLVTAAVKGLTAALAKNIWGLAILGLTLLIEKLWLAEDATQKLKNKLSDIQLDYEVKQGQDASNFEYLANAAVEAAKGSKAQKDALEELKNTYGKIIPLELLTIENLERMKGNYGELIALIDEYNLKQKYEAEKSAVEESFAPEQEKRAGIIREKLRDGLRLDYADEKTGGVFDKVLDLSERNIQRFLLNLNKYADEGKDRLLQISAASRDLAKELGLNKEETEALIQAMVNLDRGELEAQGTLMDYTEGLQRKHEALSVVNDDYDNAKQKLNEYSSIVDEVMKKNEDEPEVTTYNNTFENEKARLNNQIGDVANGIVKLFNKANVEVDNGTKQLLQTVITNGGMIPTTVWDLLEKTAENVNNPKLLDAIQSLRNHYQKLAPDNETVNFVNSGFIKIVNAAKGNMKEYRQYLYDGSVTIKEYQGNLQTSIQQLKAQAFEMVKVNALIDAGLAKGQKYDEATIKALQGKADVLQTILDQYVTPLVLPDDKKSSKSGGAKSDNRLSQLREIEQTLTTINSKYEELLKKEGQTKALADIQKIYGDTLKYINKLGGKFKLNFAMPTEFKTLQEYRKAIQDVIEKLKMKGYEKAALELQTKIDTGDVDKLGKEVEAKIKQLADRISRTKTAREFYEKILRLTRNEDLAFQATFSVYGKDTLDTFTDEVEQLKENFGEIDITAAINLDTRQIDYKKLREIWDADKVLPLNLRKIPEAYDSAIKSILDAGDKISEKQLERWGKDLERAREYADKRIELAQYTATQIAEIEAKRDSLDPESKNYAAQVALYNKMISGYREREKNEAAKLDYEQIKEQIGMFDDLGVRIGSAFQNILEQLRAYTQSPDFARLGLEAQKNVYRQIAKLEDRMAEGFQGIGIGAVSEYVRQYSTAASEYLTAQNNLRTATLRAIEADKEWARVKNSNDEAAKTAALAEKQLADSRVRTAAASVNTAGANLQATQERAARASAKFDNNLQKVEQSIRGLNNGALKALWDLLGNKGKRSVGEFLSGSYKMVSAIDKLTKALADSGSNMGDLSKTIAENLATALSGINPDDTEAIAKAATESLKQTLSSVISDKGVVELLSNTLSKNIGEIASQALSGVLSTEDAVDKVGALIDSVADAASKTGEMWGAIISLVLSLLDEFAENGVGKFLGEILDDVGDAVEGILANLLTDSLPKIIGGVGNVVKGVGTGLADMLTFGVFDLTGAKRIKRANKEIKRQQELLEQLEYSYNRLQDASDKLFGKDYINNYNQQIKNLEAQQQAYLKQAEAERSKGKKKDKEKIKEYENAARETADEIKKMQDDLVAHFTGQDQSSMARNFASAWLEAKASFASTTDAIKSKYKDMIQSMIVEGAAAKVIDNILAPMWDNMDKLLEKGDTAGAIDYLVNGMDKFITDADNGMNVLWKSLEARGYDMKKLLGETETGQTGIAKQVASASSEEINANTAALNTQNFYMGQIHADVAAMRALIEGGSSAPIPAAGAAGWTDWQQQAMDAYTAIQRNTADAVVECRRIAIACEEEVAQLRRVIVPRGTKGSHGVQVYM